MQSPSFERIVLNDSTILFSGRSYPAYGFVPRQIVRVVPIVGSDALTILGETVPRSDTYALSDRIHNLHRTDREVRTRLHSDISTIAMQPSSLDGHVHHASSQAAILERKPGRKKGSSPSAQDWADHPITVQPLSDHRI